ncbi:MAG: GGDEF domain-containing response regulator [Pseudomonadota bacterium]
MPSQTAKQSIINFPTERLGLGQSFSQTGRQERLKILVVDDDEIAREHFRRILDRTSLDSELAESGSIADGVKRFKSDRFDCIFLDYKLGDGDAFDLIGAVEREEQIIETPIILLTGMGSEQLAVKAIKSGAHDYVNKGDLAPSVLEASVRSAVAEAKLQIAERRHRQTLEHLSMHDELTGLPNRRLLIDRIQQRLSEAERTRASFAVMLVDLDLFKSVNDTLGHAAGDLVLQRLGQRFAALTRRSDTIARIGGDEFAVLLPSCSSITGAVMFAEKIEQAIEDPMEIGERTIEIGASTGIALYPGHGLTVQDLLKHADSAMYEAKASPRTFSIYSEDSDQETQDAAGMAIEISRLARSDELEIDFQPKIELSTGAVAGVEALARWQHPRFGRVMPERFIPIIERSKFVLEFTDAVIEGACEQMANWRRAGHVFPIGVNISVRVLDDPKFVRRLADCLSRYQISADLLTLEVTESMVMSHIERSGKVLNELAELGTKISIDDFGTGFSSIRYLREFPVREIKIDRLFVSGVTAAGGRDASIIAAVMHLADGFGAALVAEGIETEAQLDTLRALGCQYGQGFYLAKPMNGMELIDWVDPLTDVD